MSQVNTGPQAAVQDAAPAAPQTAATAGNVTAPVQDEFVRIPSNQMGDYGKDWHNAMRDARLGREAQQGGLLQLAQTLSGMGMTPAQMDQLLKESNQLPEQTTGINPPEPAPTNGEAAFTQDDMKKLIRDELTGFRNQQTLEQARMQQDQFGLNVLNEMGFRTDDGQGQIPSRTNMAWHLWNMALNDSKAQGIPQWYSNEQKSLALSQPATQDVLARAKTTFSSMLSDFTNETVSALADKQKQIPGATNAGGIGGQTLSKKPEEMNAQERMEWATQDWYPQLRGATG